MMKPAIGRPVGWARRAIASRNCAEMGFRRKHPAKAVMGKFSGGSGGDFA
jgi:hypothetical protein